MPSIKEFFTTYEHRRKLAHMANGLILAMLISSDIGIIQAYLKPALVAMLIGAVLMSVAVKYRIIKPIADALKLFDKPWDFKTYPGKGAIYFLVGAIFAVFFFERSVAAAAVIILGFGDPIAHYIGKYYGKTKLIVNKKKVLEGTIAGTIAGTLGAMFFLPFPVAFFGAAAGMIAEAIELEYLRMDDNFIIPLVSGLIMHLILWMA